MIRLQILNFAQIQFKMLSNIYQGHDHLSHADLLLAKRCIKRCEISNLPKLDSFL